MAKKKTEIQEIGKKATAKGKSAVKKKIAKSEPPEKKAAVKKKPAGREVKFALKATAAQWVCIVGEFNNWSADKGAMARGSGGVWTKSLRLKPGSYQYKFIVDGEWWADPENPEYCYNEHGTTNSIIDVPA